MNDMIKWAKNQINKINIKYLIIYGELRIIILIKKKKNKDTHILKNAQKYH